MKNNLLLILSQKYENVVEFYVLTGGEGWMEGTVGEWLRRRTLSWPKGMSGKVFQCRQDTDIFKTTFDNFLVEYDHFGQKKTILMSV